MNRFTNCKNRTRLSDCKSELEKTKLITQLICYVTLVTFMASFGGLGAVSHFQQTPAIFNKERRILVVAFPWKQRHSVYYYGDPERLPMTSILDTCTPACKSNDVQGSMFSSWWICQGTLSPRLLKIVWRRQSWSEIGIPRFSDTVYIHQLSSHRTVGCRAFQTKTNGLIRTDIECTFVVSTL